MGKKTVKTDEKPRIVLAEVQGDLRVKGWDRSEVVAKSSSGNDLSLEKRDDAFHIVCLNDCTLYVPHSSSLDVGTVLGDAAFKALEGELSVEEVAADLALRDVGATQLGTVGSDLSARRMRGVLEVQNVGGSVVVRDVDGQFSAKGIGGHLHLRDVSGGVSTSVGGNATLELAPVPWQAYSINAGGNIRCQLPADTNAEINISSGAQKIKVNLGEISDTIRAGNHSLTLGEGGPALNFNAGGQVDLSSQPSIWDFEEEIEVDFGGELGVMGEELSEQISQQIESHLEMLESQLDSHLAPLSASLSGAGLSEEQAERIRERIEQARERAAARAEAAAQRAQEKIKRKLAAAQRRAERKARAAAVRRARKERQKRGHVGFGGLTSSTKPAGDPITDDERMLILNMLQDKKISVEEAEELLASLEGKEA
jgi:hypothetical protein